MTAAAEDRSAEDHAAEADRINTAAFELLPALKEELNSSSSLPSIHLPIIHDDDEDLLMFLLWKLDVKRAAERYRKFIQWRLSTDNIGVFDSTLRLTHGDGDDNLEYVIRSEVIIAPSHLTTKTDGGPLLIGRLRNNDMSDGRRTPKDVVRMMFYLVDQTLSQRPEMQVHGVTILHDLRGFDVSRNASHVVAKQLFSALLGHFPIRINAIYMYKAPWAFSKMFFPVLSKVIMTKKVRHRVHFISSLDEISDVIDIDQLPTELVRDDFTGNTASSDGDDELQAATLKSKFDWNINDWIADQKQKEADVDNFRTLTSMGERKG